MKINKIRQKLNALRGESRTILWVGGLSRVYCAVTLGFFTLALIDYAIAPRSHSFRLFETFLLSTILAYAVYRRLLRPLRQPVTDGDLAQAVLRKYPHLVETLPAAVEFLPELSNESSLTGSSKPSASQIHKTTDGTALRHKVVQRAEQMIHEVDVRVLINRKVMLRWLGLALICIILTLTSFTVRPVMSWTAAVRLTQPLKSVSWPQQNHLGLLCPAERIAKGGTLTVIVYDLQGESLPSDLRLEIRNVTSRGVPVYDSSPFFENSKWESILLTQQEEQSDEIDSGEGTNPEPIDAEALFRDPLPWEACSKKIARSGRVSATQSGIMFAQISDIQGQIAYRVRGGDDYDMPWRKLEVLTRPEITDSETDLYPPEYSNLAPIHNSDTITGLPGTKVQFRAISKKPLQEAVLFFEDGKQVSCDLVDSRKTELESEFTISELSGQFAVRMTDQVGLTHFSQQRFTVRSIPDATPFIRIVRPQGNLHLTDQASVPLLVGIQDDLELTDLFLHVSRPDTVDAIEETIRLSIDSSDEILSDLLTEYGILTPHEEELLSSLGGGDKTLNSLRGPLEDVYGAVPDYRRVAWIWDLQSLELDTNATRIFRLEVHDTNGHKAVSPPYRLQIVDEEELIRRIRSQRALLIGELQEALDIQISCNEHISKFQAELFEQNETTSSTEDGESSPDVEDSEQRLETGLHTQRRVAEILTDTQNGVPWRLEVLRADITRNALEMPEILQEIRRIDQTIQSLHVDGNSDAPLGEAEIELANAARQTRLLAEALSYSNANSSSESFEIKARLEDSLSRIEASQQTILNALSSLVDQLEDSTNLRRRQAAWAEIEEEQRNLHQDTSQLASQTLTRPDARRTPPEDETAGRLANAQVRLADLTEPLLRPNGDPNDSEESPEDETTSQSDYENMTPEQRNIARTMREASDAIRENRMGQAVALQRELLKLLSEMSESNRQSPSLEPDQDTNDPTADIVSPFGERLTEWRDRQILILELTSSLKEDNSVSNPEGATISRRQLANDQGGLADLVREGTALFDQRGVIANLILHISDRMDVASARINRSQSYEQTLLLQQEAIDGLDLLAAALKDVHEDVAEEGEEPSPQNPPQDEPGPEGDVSPLELRLELELTLLLQTALYDDTIEADANSNALPLNDINQNCLALSEQQAELGRLMLLLHERMTTTSSNDPVESSPDDLAPPTSILLPNPTTFEPPSSLTPTEGSLEPPAPTTDAALLSETEAPASDIAWKMNAAARLLKQGELGETPQQLQSEIIEQIEAWIHNIPLTTEEPPHGERPDPHGPQSPPGDPNGPSPENPNGPGTPSNPEQGSSGTPQGTSDVVLTPAARQELMHRVWGTLPDSQRELMMQQPLEEFLPAYGPMIEAYFRRLAAEQEMQAP
jgi:hypothetical protein